MRRHVLPATIICCAWLLLGSACGQADDAATAAAATEDEATTPDDQAGPTAVAADAETTTRRSTSTSTTEVLSSTSTTAAPSSTSTTETPTSSSTTDPPSTGDDGEPLVGTGEIDPGLQGLVDQAVQDLAGRLSIPVPEITVQSARLVQWNDSSIGCPEPDRTYLQVLTDGSAIELMAEGTTYWYHAGGSRGLFLCTSASRIEA